MKCWFFAALVTMAALLSSTGCGNKTDAPTSEADPSSTSGSSHVAGLHADVTSNGHAESHSRQADSSRASHHGTSANHAAVDAEAALAATASPEMVVTAFLDATRRGDDALAAKLLSAKALEETNRVGLAVKPPGSPNMTYSIGRIEFPPEAEGGAYVQSTWTEKLEDGEEHFDVTWVLRKQPEGWRIVGMAAQLSDDEAPYFLNFEQPDDLYRKMQEAAVDPDAAESSDDTTTEANPAPQTASQPSSENPLR